MTVTSPGYPTTRLRFALHGAQHGGYEYFIKALNVPAPPNPLDLSSTDTAQERIRKIASCYANAESIRAVYNRPNEVMLAPANRTDLFFPAPRSAAGAAPEVFTVVAQFDILHNDNYEKGLRQRVAQGDNSLPSWPGDTILSLVIVKGEPVEGGGVDMNVLPPVPPYLQPVTDDEVRINTEQEAAARGTRLGAYRTRTVTYSGWGNADFPLLEVPRDALVQRPDLLNLTYGPLLSGGDEFVVLPPNLRTMAIDGRKFDPMDPEHPRMWLNSAEEWGPLQ